MAPFTYRDDPDFNLLMPFVFNVEGGYSKHPRDKGGPTNMGIALNYNRGALAKYGIYDARTIETLMTKDIAKQIAYEKYYLLVDCHKLHDLRLQLMHFDACFNLGPGDDWDNNAYGAKDLMRELIFAFGKNPFYYEGNGKNEPMMTEMVMFYLIRRLRFFNRKKGAQREAFLAGWINRIIALEEYQRTKLRKEQVHV